jgi:hypothetical protein
MIEQVLVADVIHAAVTQDGVDVFAQLFAHTE